MPSVSIIAAEFQDLVKTAAQGQGLPDLAPAVFPHELMLAGYIQDIDTTGRIAVDQIVHGLTKWKPAREAEANEKLVFEGADYQGAVDNMEAAFLSRRWSDGLPLVPATRERVEWILTGTDTPRDKVLTKKFGPRMGAITVGTVAINAAMAGARPEYLPILLAAVDVLATEEGLRILSVIAESAAVFAPALIVNGPVGKELNINSSYGVMGPGWKANATIGRALSLLLINGAGAFSGTAGTPRVQGLPGGYTWCFAENEDANPWQPLHVESGYSRESSTVTVMPGRGTHGMKIKVGAPEILNVIVRAVKGININRYGVPWDQLVVLAPEHAQLLAAAGHTKESIRKYVHENARVSMTEAQGAGMMLWFGEWVNKTANVKDKSMLVPITEKPEDLKIVVAGGPASGTSALIPGMKRMLTANVDKYKPANWRQLINAANKELGY
ncbi:MAG: hypothetical protein HYX83_02785 [Chloroflexi bacterium]|nr:hypothetical protein [Chloroflexota bacterium]